MSDLLPLSTVSDDLPLTVSSHDFSPLCPILATIAKRAYLKKAISAAAWQKWPFWSRHSDFQHSGCSLLALFTFADCPNRKLAMSSCLYRLSPRGPSRYVRSIPRLVHRLTVLIWILKRRATSLAVNMSLTLLRRFIFLYLSPCSWQPRNTFIPISH